MSMFPSVRAIRDRNDLLLRENKVDQLRIVKALAHDEYSSRYFKLLYAAYYYGFDHDVDRIMEKVAEGYIPFDSEDEEEVLMALILFAEFGLTNN